MPALRELQHDLRAALLEADDVAAAHMVVDDGVTPEARLAIYRHHVLTSLTGALEAAFPVIVRLVDVRFFRYAADQYIRLQPPSGPCLFEYGASLPEFLAGFPPCRDLGYLPDVARLEWAMNRALHAPDAPALGAETLRVLAPETLNALALALHPSATLLASPWPVDDIWRANQPDADGATPVALDAGPVRLLVWRKTDDVLFRALTPGGFTFLHALSRECLLAEAAAAAREADPDLDLAQLLFTLLDDEALLDCRR